MSPNHPRLFWRAWSVLTTPNDLLVEKLGLDIPPAPVLILEEISPAEIVVSWKTPEPTTSIQEFQVEVDGEFRCRTRRSENAVVISNLVSGNTHDIRVFSISSGRFQTPSAPLHVRLPTASQPSTQDGSSDGNPSIRVMAARPPPPAPTMAAPPMSRELSGGQPHGRRGTMGRKSSPAGMDPELSTDDVAKVTDDEYDGNLPELSERLKKIGEDFNAVEAQIREEEEDFRKQLKEAEMKKDKLRQDLKKRDEESSDLRKQVHKAESQNRALLNDKAKKERELQQKENDRRKKRDAIAKWDEQISTMADEMEGIETQKAAIQKRAQSDLREVQQKIEEEQKEVAALEADIKDRQGQIKALEEERKQLDVEDENDESREVDRLELEREQRWKRTFQEHNVSYGRLWQELNNAQHNLALSTSRLSLYRNTIHRPSITFAAPPAPLDLEAARRGMRSIRRPRQNGSMGSSVSSPRGPYGAETYIPAAQYNQGVNVSPTAHAPSFFNISNGMTLALPSEILSTTAEEPEPITAVPMSPHAEVLLPADLLGDESADEVDNEDVPMPRADKVETGMAPFPRIGSPVLKDSQPGDSPSPGASSGVSFSSPREAFAPVLEADRKSMHSGQISIEKDGIPESEEAPSGSKKFMPSLFSFGRQRGKTMADQGPLLGSLKSGQSQSFPRNPGDLDPASAPRRRLSYGGNWAFPGSLLQRDKDYRKAFPSMLGFGKSAEATPTYDPFAMRTNSFDPAMRGDSDSPRPSSTYSFDKMPRPSMESQFRAWNMDKPMRNSPLVPDWGSMHSFSRNPSRRQSVHYGSTSNLSLPQPDEEIMEPRRDSRPLQAPIGTRPSSSQKQLKTDGSSTPKLNPAAPSFTSMWKIKTKEMMRSKEKEPENMSPPESRKSKDAPSLAPTISTAESRESLDRTTSYTSTTPATEIKATLMSRISRKASANKFGSWKDKSNLFSRKDNTTPTGDADEDHTGSTEQLGKSVESVSNTPNGEDKKASRTSLNWSFMRKSKKGLKEDLAASEVSESSERASVDDHDETEPSIDGESQIQAEK